MRAAAQEFHSKAEEFTSDNQGVATQIAGLHWSGQASQGFRTAMEQWGESFGKVITALSELQGQVEKAGANYRDAEEVSASASAKLNTGLPNFS
jgi:WXG100 family type VII secretion target